MAIITFDNFKFDNTDAAIPATKFGAITSAGNKNLNNLYTKNGYSPDGLDLSVSASSARHGYNFVSKSGITLNNANTSLIQGVSGFSVGFSIDEYSQSGSPVLEPQFQTDLSPFLGNTTSAIYSSDGMQAIVLRPNGVGSALDLYNRNSVEGSTYTFSSNIYTTSSSATSGLLVQSIDGLYFALAMQNTDNSVSVFIFTKTGTGSSTTYTRSYQSTVGTPNITSAVFTKSGHLVVGTSSSPYIFFFARTGTNSWNKLANPTSLPTQPIIDIAARIDFNGLSETVAYLTSGGIVSGYTVSASVASASAMPVTSVPGATKIAIINGYISKTPKSDNTIYLFLTSSSPFLRMFGPSGNVMSIASPPTSVGSCINISPNNRIITIGFNSNTQPLTYKLVNNALVSTTNSYPAIPLYSINYSNDQNYLMLLSRSASSQVFYTYDNNVNVMMTISPGIVEGNNLSNYSSAVSRINLCVQDGFMFLTMFESTTGFLANGLNNISATELGFDSSFTGGYVELCFYRNPNNVNTFPALGLPYGVLLSLNGNICYCLSPEFTPLSGSSDYYTSYINGPISVTIKRDINTATSTSIPFHVTDLYITDGSGINNTLNLGPVTVETDELTSDNTVQWSSSQVEDHYSILSNDPPDITKYVFTNVAENSDQLGFNNSSDSNAYATKINVIAKTSTSSSVGLMINDGSMSSPKLSLSTAYSEIDYVTNKKSVYACYNYLGGGIDIMKVAGNTISKLTHDLVGIFASTAFSSDAKYLIVGTGSSAKRAILLKNINDSYVTLPNAFTEVVGGSPIVDMSRNDKFVCFSTTSNIYFYLNNFDDTFTLIQTFPIAVSPTGGKFSKSSKYYFLSTNTNSTSRMFKLDSTLNTVTEITGTNAWISSTASSLNIDTGSDINGVDYVAKIISSAPFLRLYKMEADDSVTQLTVTTQTAMTLPPVSISFVYPYSLGDTRAFSISAIWNNGSNVLQSANATLAVSSSTLPAFTISNNLNNNGVSGTYLTQTFSPNCLALIGHTSFSQMKYIGNQTLTATGLLPISTANITSTNQIIFISCVETNPNVNTLGYTYKL